MAEKEVINNKKKSNWLFTLFACVATGFIVYMSMNLGDKAGKLVCPPVNNFSETNEKVEIADVIGSYKNTLETKSGDLALKIDHIYTFYEDGTFKLSIVRTNSGGFEAYGNYYIDDDKIVIYTRLSLNEASYEAPNTKEVISIKDKSTLVITEEDGSESIYSKENTDIDLKENKNYKDTLLDITKGYNKAYGI